jgi:hypothetical protein
MRRKRVRSEKGQERDRGMSKKNSEMKKRSNWCNWNSRKLNNSMSASQRVGRSPRKAAAVGSSSSSA